MKLNKILLTGLLATLFGTGLATSGSALAASSSCTGSPACTTGNVPLNFEIRIPQFVRLRIGAAGSTDIIVFDMTSTPALVGDSSVVAGTGGDATAGAVNVRVMANGAGLSVNVNATTSGGSGLACQGGSGSCAPGSDFINWNEITVTAPAPCTVGPPALQNSGTTTANYAAVAPLKESCTWTYAYDNNTVPVDSTYSGTVTYTATSL